MADATGTVQTRDLRRELKALYTAPVATPVIVDVPALHFLMVDGKGDPNTPPEFANAVEALYGVSYALKFMAKKGALAIDYPVMPLEALLWADDMEAFRSGDRSAWRWTAMILQPDFLTATMIADAIAATRKKKPNPALDQLRLETFAEGRAAQLMHIGPFNAEGPNIEKLHAFIAAEGTALSGKHHEIYLSDMRRTAPDKLKTLIRQPFIRS